MREIKESMKQPKQSKHENELRFSQTQSITTQTNDAQIARTDDEEQRKWERTRQVSNKLTWKSPQVDFFLQTPPSLHSFLAFSIIVNPLSPANSLSKTFFQKPLTLEPKKESTSMPSSSPLNFSLFFLSHFFFSHCSVPSSNSYMESLLLSPETFLLNLYVSDNLVHSISSSPPKTSLPNPFSSIHSHFFSKSPLNSLSKIQKISRPTSSAHSSLSQNGFLKTATSPSHSRS